MFIDVNVHSEKYFLQG